MRHAGDAMPRRIAKPPAHPGPDRSAQTGTLGGQSHQLRSRLKRIRLSHGGFSTTP